MPESYQIIFNSQGTNVLNRTDLNNVVYNVNWAAFLPQKYKRFKCQFVFKSAYFAGDLEDTGFVNIDFGRVDIYDGQQMTQNIGMIQPQINYGVAITSFYNATVNDNIEFYCNYPTSSSVLVKLKRFNGTTNLPDMPEYVLTLSFTGIE